MDRFVRADERNSYFTLIDTPPYGAPVLCVNLTDPADGQEYVVTVRYTVEVFNLRIDDDGLTQVPYSRLADLDESIAVYLAPEKLAESDRDEIHGVYNHLFPTGISGDVPIADAASTIYDWVLRHCTYTKNAAMGRAQVLWGAMDMLNNGRGECGEYTALFVAVCRAAGIPARAQVGFFVKGPNNVHVWAEFYVPGFGWVPVDPSMGDMNPRRNYFAQIPGLNRRVSVTHGFDHIVGDTRIHSLQSYSYWFKYKGRPTKLDTTYRFTAVPS
jgi:transglutaminase-like putative cysteine protease